MFLPRRGFLSKFNMLECPKNGEPNRSSRCVTSLILTYKIFVFMSFLKIVLLVVEDPTAIELCYAGGSCSTLVVDTDE